MMNLQTYGKYDCHIYLARLLNEYDDNKITRKVGSMFNEYCLKLKSVKDVIDKNHKIYLLYLVRDDFLNRVKKHYSGLPILIQNLLNNCIHTNCKELLRDVKFRTKGL